MNIQTPVIIFSVFTLSRSYGENQLEHNKVLDLLKKNAIGHKTLEGRYGGVNEASILVEDTVDTRTLVKHLAKLHNQESVLFLDSNRHATLVQVFSNKVTSLGPLFASNVCPDTENYSYDGITNTFYYTKG